MTIRSFLAGCAITLLIATASSTGALAQEPFTPELREGDIVWTFANEDPFYDGRVAGALAALMAARIEVETPDGPRIVRVESDGPGYTAATQYAEIEVEPLLAAAGFDPAQPFELVGACHFWEPEPRPAEPNAPAWGTPASPAGIVMSAFQDALRALSIVPVACESVDDPGDAHIIAWQWGEDAPVLPTRPAGTLLTGTEAALGPTTGEGGGTGGGDVTPAVTGNAGLAEGSNAALAVVGIGATVLLVVAARRRTA